MKLIRCFFVNEERWLQTSWQSVKAFDCNSKKDPQNGHHFEKNYIKKYLHTYKLWIKYVDFKFYDNPSRLLIVVVENKHKIASILKQEGNKKNALKLLHLCPKYVDSKCHVTVIRRETNGQTKILTEDMPNAQVKTPC